LSIIGASAALSLSKIPFEGPVGAVIVGLIDGKPVINPNQDETQQSNLHLMLAGTKEAVMMVEAGAKGLVLFNRFYQPDLDIENLTVEPSLLLSKSSDMLLPLRWTAILYERIKADIAFSSGVHTGEDMVKALMAGASVTMTASELVKNGIQRAESMLLELSNWMDIHGYESVDSLRGILSQRSVAFPAAFERANYMKALTQFDESI